jgi:hypothetical protein
MFIVLILTLTILLLVAGFIVAIYFICQLFIKQINHMCYLAITGNPERAVELSKVFSEPIATAEPDLVKEGDQMLKDTLGY